MIEQSIKNIIKLWNFEDNTIKQIYDTTWQVGDKYILKIYSNKNMMKRNIEIFKNLKEEGIPVGNVIKTITGQDYAEYNDKYYFIYTKLSGSNIVKINNNMNLALTVGKVIADLHLALLNCEKKIEVYDLK